eukprot:391690_1
MLNIPRAFKTTVMVMSITNVCIMIFLTEIAYHVNAQTIDCDNTLTCPYNTFNCDTVNNVDCIIKCLTSFSCEEAIFHGGVGNMEINCGANACNYATFNGGNGTMVINCDQNACSGTTWNGGNGDLIATCTGEYSCNEGYMHCPSGKYCNITCDGTNACSPGNINSGDGNTIINVIASGNEALGHVNIYCPQNFIRGGSPNSCNIYGYNTSNDFMMSKLKIYALEGYHDVNIICDNGNQGCWENYQSNTRATLYCTPGWTENCELSWDSNDVNNVKCFQPPSTAPTVHICEDYLLPTSIPTVQPTNSTTTTAPTSTTTTPTSSEPTIYPTFDPTPSPTRYHPNNGRRQIYVSEHGCDYGYCMNKNYTNYDDETDNFDYCDYNSACCDIPSAISSCQDIIDSWERSKGPYGSYPGDKIIKINAPGIWSGSVIGDDGSEDNTRDLIRIVCFQIETPFICVNPKLNLEFEDISYAYTVPYHFNVSYQNESEVAGCSGGSGTKTCGSWYECPVDVQPIDGPWIPDGSGHAFWIRDSQPAGQVWRPECHDPRRTFNVRVSVNCSTIDVNPPKCRTLDYTWSCFNGIYGAPVDTVCSDVGYDGNGEIKISRGTYTLNDNIYVQAAYQQVVIEGRGFNHTFLNQIISNNNIVISCQLCNLTMKGFTYNIESSGAAASASNIIIEIFNNGNTTFDDVIFMSDVQRLKFIFYNYSNVEFTNCTFQKNVTFDVSNGATVSFRKCTFMNISGNVETTEIPYNDATTTTENDIFTTNRDDVGITSTTQINHGQGNGGDKLVIGTVKYIWITVMLYIGGHCS